MPKTVYYSRLNGTIDLVRGAIQINEQYGLDRFVDRAVFLDENGKVFESRSLRKEEEPTLVDAIVIGAPIGEKAEGAIIAAELVCYRESEETYMKMALNRFRSSSIIKLVELV